MPAGIKPSSLSTPIAERLGATADSLYDVFCAVNERVKQVVTDWQLRAGDGPPILTDDTDPQYDPAVVERLRDGHDEVLPIIPLVGRQGTPLQPVPLTPRRGHRQGPQQGRLLRSLTWQGQD